MTNKEKYQRTFGVLHASEDVLTEVRNMKTKKHLSLRRTGLLCAAVILLFALAGIGYAENVGGIQRRIQLWRYGDQTDAILEIQGGGGVAIDAFGRERSLTEDELMEELQENIDVLHKEDGTVWVYYQDQSLEITDLFDENGVCYVQLQGDGQTVYLTVEYQGGYAWSTTGYVERNG